MNKSKKLAREFCSFLLYESRKPRPFILYNRITKTSRTINAPNINILYCLLESFDPNEIITDPLTNEIVSNRQRDNITRVNSITINNFDICKDCRKAIVVQTDGLWFCNHCNSIKRYNVNIIKDNNRFKVVFNKSLSKETYKYLNLVRKFKKNYEKGKTTIEYYFLVRSSLDDVIKHLEFQLLQ